MADLEYMLCPEGHAICYSRGNAARDFSDNEKDAMSLQPMFEWGLFCLGCNRAYGMSKLKEPENKHELGKNS